MQTTVKKTNEEIKVLAVNTLYEWAKKFFDYEYSHFKQFIGQDIFKADGTIKKKFDHEKISFEGKLPDGTYLNAHYWFESSRGYFDICVKICINGGSYDVRPATAFCQYEQQTLTLFKLDNYHLVETATDTDFLNSRYDVESLQKTAAEIKEAAKMYEAAAAKMPYRFKDVFWIERLTR